MRHGHALLSSVHVSVDQPTRIATPVLRRETAIRRRRYSREARRAGEVQQIAEGARAAAANHTRYDHEGEAAAGETFLNEDDSHSA